MPARERLRAQYLRTALKGSLIGCDIIVLEETGSTNDVVSEMARGDWPEGLVVFAEHQTAGRGQRGNRWESCRGKSLAFSVLLRPQMAPAQTPALSEWAARTVARTIETTCLLQAQVKLPNDVYVGDRKIAGVLVEMRAQPGAPHTAVLGIGLNVNHSATDFPGELRERATSLAILRRGRVDRHHIAIELLKELDRSYSELFSR
jgi:BirA family biotin operon repressor/biotin-[acetyl-CoA-carboxylase] ligase